MSQNDFRLNEDAVLNSIVTFLGAADFARLSGNIELCLNNEYHALKMAEMLGKKAMDATIHRLAIRGALYPGYERIIDFGDILSRAKSIDDIRKRSALRKARHRKLMMPAKRFIQGIESWVSVSNIHHKDDDSAVFVDNISYREIGQRVGIDLNDLYGYWDSLKIRKKNFPLVSDIDYNIISQIGLAGFVHIIDSSDFTIGSQVVSYAGLVELESGQDLTGHVIRPDDENRYLQALNKDYFTATMTGRPMASIVLGVYRETLRNYGRLILPFSRSGDKPDILMIGVNTRLPCNLPSLDDIDPHTIGRAA